MPNIHIDKTTLHQTGFLDFSIDPSLDLVKEIEKLKKEKNKLKKFL